MPDAERSELAAVLDELCQAVGADGGGALYLDDGDGTLQLAATTTGTEKSGNASRSAARQVRPTLTTAGR